MSELHTDCGHKTDRLFYCLTIEGRDKFLLFKKKFGKLLYDDLVKIAKFSDSYMSHSYNENENVFYICPSCFDKWRDNTR